MDLPATHNSERSTIRLKAKKRALVWCHQGDESLPYHLLDISQEGLSFRYLGKQLEAESIKQVSLLHETTMIVESIPVLQDSDFLLEDSLVQVRRASVLFKNMNAEQSRNLQYFIGKHTEQSQAR